PTRRHRSRRACSMLHRRKARTVHSAENARIDSGADTDERKTAAVVLADLEHVFRIPGHPVRLRAADREREPHLPDAGRGHGAGARAVDRRAADRAPGAAGGRLLLRPYLDAAGPAPAV